MPQDPAMLMADMFLRYVAIHAVQVLVWTPLLIGLVWLHASLTRK